jgi:hypothetical protein
MPFRHSNFQGQKYSHNSDATSPEMGAFGRVPATADMKTMIVTKVPKI